MNVQTYEATEAELRENAPEMEAESIELIEALGLDGQKRLLTKDENETVTRCPYRSMTAEENRVYGVLCPNHVEVEEYDAGPIPLRVLQVASHATTMFDKIEVWCPLDAVDDDPILVGVTKKNPGSYGDKYSILARWGGTLLPFTELVEMAAKRWKETSKASAEDKIVRARAFVSAIDAKVIAYFRGDYVSVP